ncbi:hypothetical protein HMI55_005118 [Coelomomyces lativittatus]|nr:hypothetical protein HMI56_006144 [Coelomomyces lativittatus]KAJ1513915.1 hypothetical protein HMI55_005118 [Coelomomyces lativittatus]
MLNQEYFEKLHEAFHNRSGHVVIHSIPREMEGIKQAHKLANMAAHVSYWHSLPSTSTTWPVTIDSKVTTVH